MPELERAASKIKPCDCRTEYIGAGDSEITYCIVHEKAEDMYQLLLKLSASAGKNSNSILYAAIKIIEEIDKEYE